MPAPWGCTKIMKRDICGHTPVSFRMALWEGISRAQKAPMRKGIRLSSNCGTGETASLTSGSSGLWMVSGPHRGHMVGRH